MGEISIMLAWRGFFLKKKGESAAVRMNRGTDHDLELKQVQMHSTKKANRGVSVQLCQRSEIFKGFGNSERS